MQDSEGSRKDGSICTGPESDVQGVGGVGDIIWQRELGGDRVDAQGPDGIPPSGGATDHRDDGETRFMRRVGVPIGRGVDGSRRARPHWGVHKEAEDDHSREVGIPPHL